MPIFSKEFMDSINRQQREENKKTLNGHEAAIKIKELADAAKSCFFCTNIKSGGPFETRPMSPQDVDDDGNIWSCKPTLMCNYFFREASIATL
jgi:hypothetical protein